ncbi:MAG: glutathione S-transferase family protein [Spirochaetales bacterium]|nr:glutathione S-transferase family protein [Spirochaetales bacterium]MCP5485501.1 glutathione S-transferase family protein [Spirochaetales bacterium]
MLEVYGMTLSGNCYKVRLLLELINRTYKWIEVDTRRGETRTAAFLKMNPNGKIPVLKLEDSRCLPESNAILYYLSQGTPFFPTDTFDAASVLQWMFFEQYSHEPYIAINRSLIHIHKKAEQNAELIRQNDVKGHAALQVMESHLKDRTFFVAERYTIADIALYAYTHLAPEGNFDLERYPALRQWLERVADHPHHVPMA